MGTVDVSIVVPVFNQWPLTEACLRSLAASAAGSLRTAEIILADDGSTDETTIRWRQFEDGRWPVRYHRNAENLRFLLNCNEAARLAQGRYLCFLNNDVEVPEGWLDRLVETLESAPNIGVVGPLFLDEFGQILECGAVVHSDGTAKQLGRGASVSDRRYLFKNDVDYVSGACLLLRGDAFRKYGGFDERYVPCYYEDTDLCLKLAADGFRTVVDPRVRIVHHEGSSNGADTGGGLKRYQELNRDRFFKRWKERLLSRHSSAEEEVYDRMRIWRRKQVVVCHASHLPTCDDGARIAPSWTWLSALVDRGCHVVVVSPEGTTDAGDALHVAGVETAQARRGGDPDCRSLIHAYRPVAALFADAHAEREYGKTYSEFSPDTIRVYDASSATALTTAAQRAADLAGGDSAGETLMPAAEELNAVASAMRCDVTVVGTPEMRRLLRERLFFDEERVRVIDRRTSADSTRSRDASTTRSVEAPVTTSTPVNGGRTVAALEAVPGRSTVHASAPESDTRHDSASIASALLAIISDARGLRKEPSRWSLASRLLWHARGYPGAPEDFRQSLDSLEKRLESQRALVEQYRLTLQQHRMNETRLARELYESLGASRKLLQRTT